MFLGFQEPSLREYFLNFPDQIEHSLRLSRKDFHLKLLKVSIAALTHSAGDPISGPEQPVNDEADTELSTLAMEFWRRSLAELARSNDDDRNQLGNVQDLKEILEAVFGLPNSVVAARKFEKATNIYDATPEHISMLGPTPEAVDETLRNLGALVDRAQRTPGSPQATDPSNPEWIFGTVAKLHRCNWLKATASPAAFAAFLFARHAYSSFTPPADPPAGHKSENISEFERVMRLYASAVGRHAYH